MINERILEEEGSGVLRAVDLRLLAALRDCGRDPRVAAAARALSWSGEHGALWLAGGLAGAALEIGRAHV